MELGQRLLELGQRLLELGQRLLELGQRLLELGGRYCIRDAVLETSGRGLSQRRQ